MALPPFEDDGNLPPGIHPCSWQEFSQRFGFNRHRRQLLGGLLAALRNFRAAGATGVWLDGSFVTSKPNPGDWDGCYDWRGVDIDLLDPVFKDTVDLFTGRPRQKQKFGGEMLMAVLPAGKHGSILDLFQLDKNTDLPKGIVAIDMSTV